MMSVNLLIIPKIELHCHLDGSVRLETLKELGIQAGVLQEGLSDEALIRLAQVPENCPSLVDYLKRFDLPLSVMQNSEALGRIARELVEDAAAEHVVYLEVRFAPHLHLKGGLSLAQVIESVLHGLKSGEKATGTRANLILCCMRHMPPEASEELVEAGMPFLGRGVVALDLAGDEAHFPPELHQSAFEKAKASGYRVTVHAGETGIAENIRTAIERLHAERIGHGVSLMKDPALLDALIQSGIPLEMCPTSNLHTKAAASYSQHPLHDYLQSGVKVTLNTDNRTVSSITLTEELRHMTDAGLSGTQLRALYLNAAEVIFDSEAEKERLRALWPE